MSTLALDGGESRFGAGLEYHDLHPPRIAAGRLRDERERNVVVTAGGRGYPNGYSCGILTEARCQVPARLDW